MANINGPFGLRARPASARIDDCAERLHDCERLREQYLHRRSGHADRHRQQHPSRCRHGGNADRQWLWRLRGCFFTDATGKPTFSKYWPSGTVAADAVALVWDDPQIIFEAQSLSFALNDIGALVDFTAAAGNTKTGLSGAYLDSTTGTTGKTFRLLRLVPRPDNVVGAYAKVEVLYVEHALLGVVSGVGGV